MSRLPATAYNKYIKEYSPWLVRRYQSGKYLPLGRRSGFDILVMKYASDHLISEEQHSWKHATPIWLKQFSNRFGFMMYLYSTFVMVLMLGKQSQWIQMDSKSLGGESFGMGELPFKYEDVYSVYKPQIGGPNL